MTSFKVVRTLYSRYFGFSFFKLKLSNIDQLFYINVLTGVSAATLSLIFIGSGAGTSYDDSSKGQTFFFGLDCVLVTIVMIIFTICEVQKEKEFFEEKKEIDNQSLFTQFLMAQSMGPNAKDTNNRRGIGERRNSGLNFFGEDTKTH